MGDRLRQLRRAFLALSTQPDLQICGVSSVYETEYVGLGSQDPYYNACVILQTALAPLSLLKVLKDIETQAGRPAAGHMLPRPIDLDILLFGDTILTGEKLCVPHKNMRERAFVMEPLAEIAPSQKFPDSGETIGTVCAKIRQKEGPWVKRLVGEGLLPASLSVASFAELNQEDWRAALAVYCR